MASFIAIIDPDDDRRSRFEHAVQPLLAIVDGLTRGRCAVGRFLALWAAADGAPVSCACGANSAAIIWGDAINDPTGQTIGASSLEDRWNDPKTPGAPARWLSRSADLPRRTGNIDGRSRSPRPLPHLLRGSG